MEHERLTVEKMNPHSEGILEIPLTKGGNYAIITELRGVAQVVARQFRVLEAASSSPATSTKKAIGEQRSPMAFLLSVAVKKICSLCCGTGTSSVAPPVDRKARFPGAGRGHFRRRRMTRKMLLKAFALRTEA